MKTIPEIADMLRHHINNDNSAPRLIVEHILPLIGLEFDTVEEVRALADTADLVSDWAEELATLKRDFTDQIDATAKRLAEDEKELNDLSDTLEPETAERVQAAALSIGCRIDDLNELRAIGDDIKDLVGRMRV